MIWGNPSVCRTILDTLASCNQGPDVETTTQLEPNLEPLWGQMCWISRGWRWEDKQLAWSLEHSQILPPCQDEGTIWASLLPYILKKGHTCRFLIHLDPDRLGKVSTTNDVITAAKILTKLHISSSSFFWLGGSQKPCLHCSITVWNFLQKDGKFFTKI